MFNVIKFIDAPAVTVANMTFNEMDANRTITCQADGNPRTYTFFKWKHLSLLGTFIRELDGSSDGRLQLPADYRYQDNGIYLCSVESGIRDQHGDTIQSGQGYLTVQG